MSQKLPVEVVTTLEKLAEASGWRAANERAGFKKDVQRDLQTIAHTSKELEKQLSEKCGFAPGTHQALVDLCGYAGWHAANVRANNTKDADNDWRHMEGITFALEKKGEMSPVLIEHIRALADALAWYTANTRKNLQSEADADLMKVPLLRELLTKH